MPSKLPSGVTVIDGKVVAVDDAAVSVFDRGFLYGDSVFETLRTYGGRLFRRDAHIERLFRSCERILIQPGIGATELAAEMDHAMLGLNLPECVVRVVITRGIGPLGLDVRRAQDPLRVVMALPLSPPAREVYETGIGAGLSHGARATDGTAAAGAKYSNYLSSVLALHHAHEQGQSEAIAVGMHGEILEGTTSNLFLIRSGILCTPPLQSGILEGITRRVVLELARELGIPTHVGLIFPSDAYGAAEAFITGTVREIVPVTRIDDVVIGNGIPGPTTRRLLDAFRAHAMQTAGT
jgi:branched-chain amino acid aminotransferase